MGFGEGREPFFRKVPSPPQYSFPTTPYPCSIPASVPNASAKASRVRTPPSAKRTPCSGEAWLSANRSLSATMIPRWRAASAKATAAHGSGSLSQQKNPVVRVSSGKPSSN